MENSFLKSSSASGRPTRPRFAARLLLAACFLAGPFGAFAQKEASALSRTGGGHWWSAEAEQALARAGKNRSELTGALSRVPVAQRAGLQFLLENMPAGDLQRVSGAFLLGNLAGAYQTMKESPWGKTVPSDIFLNNILPYVCINERREDWRKLLHDQCAPLVADCKTPGEAAQRLNEKIFPLFKVKYSTERRRAEQSPSESIASGLASCTGLSILLIDACRSVGVPARLAGIPNWVDNRGNHTWVEVWDGRWHFTGAAEPDARGLDHTWFQADAALAIKDSKEHAIYATSFKRTGLAFPLVWAPGLDTVSAINVTDNYTPKSAVADTHKTRLMVKVMDRPGGIRVAAKVNVTDTRDPAIKFEGVSRDEKFDRNDFLSFELPQNRTYSIEARFGKQKAASEFACRTNGQELVVICLGDTPAAPAAEIRPLKKDQEAKLNQALTNFFSAPPEQQAAWKFDRSLDLLLRDNEPAVRRVAWEAYRTAPLHETLKQDYGSNRVTFQNHLSPYTVRSVGVRPANGWPLFIAMHGGGNAPKALNDSQWRDMQRYYRDQTNVTGYLYLALRAPNDTWNGFYDDYVYPLVDNLTRQFRVFGDIDPNKVFIMGYSHGGYGAFAIGPKMPDHFAAIHASASAPTDGETSAKTLRTTPFAFMVGENDTAYGRLDRCKAFDELIRKLRGDRTNIYPVTFEYEPGFGHGGLPDRNKIKDMYPSVRNPVPAELSWEMTDHVIQNFFWLQVPKPEKKQEIDATCRNNRITVTTDHVTAASVLLDSRLIDFKRPVILEVNGAGSTRKVQPGLMVLCQTLLERGDPDLAFTAKINLPL